MSKEIVLLIVVLFLMVGSTCRGAFVDESVAVTSLEKQGYTDIKIIDHDWFLVGWKGCDEKDAAKFTAIAKNPIGNEVEVFICTGWFFKGATIRTK